MIQARIIHNEVYDLLIKLREQDSSLYFTFRKSNRGNKLEDGYLFYGNEYYLAISFWTGMDWKNKTPNIIFVILLDSGATYLEINTSDSDEKRKFVSLHLASKLKLEASGQRYRKFYTEMGMDYLTSLKMFLNTDKKLIDQVIEENSLAFFKDESNIGFIDKTDFEEQKIKVDFYRIKLKQKRKSELAGINNKPKKIRNVKIENYGPIKSIEIKDIPFSNQWIFFTGENGTGKTSLLRALATAICFRNINIDEIDPDNPFIVNLQLYVSDGKTIPFNRDGDLIVENNSFLMSGFASYGQSRLKTSHSGVSSATLKNISHDSLFSSLFDEDSYLIDLQRQFDIWKNEKATEGGHYKKRINYITEILTDIIPNLYNILFDDRIGDISVTSYIEKDNEGAEFKKVPFHKLASGLKSMIAMIGDIMVRLYQQQRNVDDPSEFTGVVLIDEIDIHLHPKLQKLLVEQLTKTFPKIQFIVSTHSPIPLLGAPTNSQIFKVERNASTGVQVKRLDNKLILGDLLPNTILTSPIFGFDNIVPNSHDPQNIIRTELNYKEIEFSDLVTRKVNDFLTDKKEQELINLFKSRRK